MEMDKEFEENDFQEYVTFTVTTKDGNEVEMAVVDEFDFKNKHYVVGALIEGDTINEDGMYIYKSVIKGDDFTVEKINSEVEYKQVAEAYLKLS
ncbi:MAG: DUF1292 domain-containing protein [Lachnospiraceae bacterium]|nr:DUF1292 domain-containing protein [Lachnospiraceae bacterium]